MPELCPKCGSEMGESYSTPGNFFCPLPNKDCRIKELERQLEELRREYSSLIDTWNDLRRERDGLEQKLWEKRHEPSDDLS